MAYLHFSGTRAIESGGHDIKDANNGNGDKEPREDDRYQDYSSDNVGKGVEEHAEGVCEINSEYTTRRTRKNEPASTLSIVSTSLENRFMIRPTGYVQDSARGETQSISVAHCCLKERHWAVHDAADGILPSRQGRSKRQTKKTYVM
jgi:hypothetical protein